MTKTFIVILAVVLVLFFLVPTLITRTCYDNNSLAVTSYVLFVLSNAAIIILPFIFTLKTGDFKKGVLFCWCLQMLSEIAFIYYGVVLFAHCKQNELDTLFVADRFPDGPRIIGVLFFGWLPALVICGIAFAIHRATKKGRTAEVPPSHTDAG